MLWKIGRWLLVVVACLFLLAQFGRPARTNPVVNESDALQSHVQVTPQVAGILDRSCNDCHSNKTRWPWYSNVAPVSWFLIDHVNEGREHLNFSEWGKLDRSSAAQTLDEMCEEVKAGAMPLSSYTPLHPGSKLSEADVKVLCDWTEVEVDKLKKVVPAGK